ncbi:MAG: endolytic transglycosylase MltG [Spirochaetota bacterium]|nr:endolytic transglycosylase MltG [Spirochaetota bacterium]
MKIIKYVLIFLFSILIIFAILFLYFNSSLDQGKNITFEIHNKENPADIAKRLKDENIIRNKDFFYYYTKLLLRFGKKIHKGKYLLNDRQTTSEILLDYFMKKDQAKAEQIELTIPEGYNIYDIANLFLEKKLINNIDDFLNIAFDKNLIMQHNIEGDSIEGYLYPSTYYLHKNESAISIVNKLIATFKSKFPQSEFDKLKDKIKLTKHQIITLASLIEKETGVPNERTLVSSVFHNRLNTYNQFKSKMRLACDPTVIYGLLREAYSKDLKIKQSKFTLVYDLLKRGKTQEALNIAVRILRKEKLNLSHASVSKYNTYRYTELPPSPIANPSDKSILAALNPQNTKYRYFVAKNDKSHLFAETENEHNKNIKSFREWKNSKKP